MTMQLGKVAILKCNKEMVVLTKYLILSGLFLLLQQKVSFALSSLNSNIIFIVLYLFLIENGKSVLLSVNWLPNQS